MSKQSIYNLTLADYIQLSDTGNGSLIYGSDWPANISIFKSMKSRYLAVKQMYQVVEDVTGATGISAEDLIGLITSYSELFMDITKDIENGVISQDDIDALIFDLDGGDDE